MDCRKRRRETPDEKTRKEIREFFGIEKLERKPIDCNSFKFMVKVFSLMPDQQNNPFANYANDPDYNSGIVWPKANAAGGSNSVREITGLDGHDRAKSHTSVCPFLLRKDGVGDNSVPGRKEDGSSVSVHPLGVEVGDSPHHNELKSDSTSGTWSKDTVLSGQGMIIDELGISKNSEVMDKVTRDEDTNVETVGSRDVNDDLTNILRIMDQSDDEDMQQLMDEGVNLELARDFGSILDMDKSGDKSLTMESIEIEKLTTGEITTEKMVGQNKSTDVEVNKSNLEFGTGVSQAQKSIDASPGFVNQNGRSKDEKLSSQIIQQDRSEIRDLTFTGSENENVKEFDGKFVGNLEGMDISVTSANVKKAKGKNTKAKNSKMSKTDIFTEKHKLVRGKGKADNSARSESRDAMVHGKRKTQHEIEISRRPSTKEDEECRPNSSERLRYTREQLLHLKTAFVPEHVKKDVQEIGAEIRKKIENQHIAAAFKTAIPEILKNKKRGSSAEGKKRRKKQQKWKKQGEHGPRRKIRMPKEKPKVVPLCRHYLNGRCHKGDECQFSHDGVPLTKSKPCLHFARQSCMKGDDCPFDHQLSKYPCDNFVDRGFCSRGQSCLFSHKISVKKEPDTSSMDQNNMSKSKQQIEVSLPITSRKSTPNMVLETLATKTGPPAKKPKGLTFVSFGGSLLNNSIQAKEPDLVATVTNIHGSGTQGIDFPSFDRTSTDTSKQPSVPPRKDNSSGHNSFGTPLFNDSTDHQPKETLARYDFAIGIPPQRRAFSLSEMSNGIPSPTRSPEKNHNSFKMSGGSPTQEKAEEIVPSQTKKALNFSKMNLDTPSLNPNRALNLPEMLKGSSTPAEKMLKGASTPEKKVQPEPGLRGSQISSSQYSTKAAQSDTQSQNKAFNFSDIFKGFPTPSTDWAVNGSDMFKGAPTQANAQGNSLSSSDGQSFGTPDGKSASIFPSKRDSNLPFVFGEKGNINVSEKSEVLPEQRLRGSQTTSSQNSAKVDLPLKNVPSNSQRALQSALAFAAKYQSGIKKSTDSGSRPSEPLQGSKILQFLNHQVDKEKH